MLPRIPLSAPHLELDVLAGLDRAIQSNWIAHVGPSVDAFEEELAAHVGAAGCVATHSGTAALHLALRLAGVQAGDTVLCSSATFVASATPILYLGARPVFIDADEGGSMSPHALERALRVSRARGLRVRCIVVVHLFGQPADMSAITPLAQRYQVPIVEDAAQALGAHHGGRALGTIGLLGAYSFAGNKIITTSTGGALVSNDRALIARARWLAQQAREDVPHYEHRELGHNYRLSNVLAEIGRSQLRVLEDRVAARREKFARYREAFAGVPGVSFLPEPEHGHSNRWLSALLLDPACGLSPEALVVELAQRGIESRRVFKPLHRQPLFRGAAYYSHGDSISDRLFAQGVCLPSSSNLGAGDQARVIAAVLQALARPPRRAASQR